MIAEAVAAADNPRAARVEGTAAADGGTEGSSNVGWGTRTRQILLTGVSYMIPFVAAGGLLIALGFLFGGYDIADNGQDIALNNSLTNLPDGGLTTYLGAILFTLGGLAFSFLVPALAGYISFAIADRPGIAPGFTAGALAVFVGGGFIGGIVGGVIAGFTALWISNIEVPRWLRGLMPVVIIPLLASLSVGLIMFFLIGRPLAWVNTSLTDWLNGLTGTSAVFLGVILGLMMCSISVGRSTRPPMPSPPQAWRRPPPPPSRSWRRSWRRVWSRHWPWRSPRRSARPCSASPREENGRAAWLLGASFISEGAIPFAAADPLRVILSMMTGGAITGALCMAFGVTLRPRTAAS